MRLTDQGIRGLPFQDAGQRDYPDAAVSGLSVRVGKRTKTFMLVAGKGGTRKRYTLGRYDPPAFTLAMAREKAKDILAERRLSPALTAKASPSFEEAVRTYFQTHALSTRANSQKQNSRLLNRHFMPLFRKRDLDDIETGEIVAVFDRLLPTPSEANHAFTTARAFFRWAAKRRLIDRSPMEGLDLPAQVHPRTRVLTEAELVAVWRACEGNQYYGPFVRLLILTGQRRGQFAHLRGEMIDRRKQTITWPHELMKADKEHTIPYGPMMAEIIQTMPDIGLALRSACDIPFNNSNSVKRALDKRCSFPHWTIHDLRRTWATISAEQLDTPPHIIEAVLAHQSGTAVARTYNRAKYIEPMRKAMIAFEDWLQTLLSNTESTNDTNLSGVHRVRA